MVIKIKQNRTKLNGGSLIESSKSTVRGSLKSCSSSYDRLVRV